MTISDTRTQTASLDRRMIRATLRDGVLAFFAFLGAQTFFRLEDSWSRSVLHAMLLSVGITAWLFFQRRRSPVSRDS